MFRAGRQDAHGIDFCAAIDGAQTGEQTSGGSLGEGAGDEHQVRGILTYFEQCFVRMHAVLYLAAQRCERRFQLVWNPLIGLEQ